MSGKVTEQGFAVEEDGGVAGIYGPVHVDAEWASVQNVVDSLCPDVTLLEEAQSVSDSTHFSVADVLRHNQS